NITLQILNTAGQIVASASRSLGPHQHLATFVTELFPGLPPMAGILEISAPDPLVSMALRFDSKLAVFTTLFPFPAPELHAVSRTICGSKSNLLTSEIEAGSESVLPGGLRGGRFPALSVPDS